MNHLRVAFAPYWVPGAVLRRAGRDVHRHGTGDLGCDRRGV